LTGGALGVFPDGRNGRRGAGFAGQDPVMHKPAPNDLHPALRRARRLTRRPRARALRIPLALNLSRATALAAALLGLRLVL
jgi:hypothetical protein